MTRGRCIQQFSVLLSKVSKLRYPRGVRMAERSKALRSGRSPLLWAWVRIPLLTKPFRKMHIVGMIYLVKDI